MFINENCLQLSGCYPEMTQSLHGSAATNNRVDYNNLDYGGKTIQEKFLMLLIKRTLPYPINGLMFCNWTFLCILVILLTRAWGKL